MPEKCIARIAVSAATYWTDRPYDYLVPPELAGQIRPGVRVIVPFSRGNRKCEGLVLAVRNDSDCDRLKTVSSMLDTQPILTPEQIRLALWMRERYWCTVYDALKAILPAGLWYDISATVRLAEGYDRETAYAAAGRSAAQTRVLEVLFANGGTCDRQVIDRAFGDEDPGSAISTLVKKGVIQTDSREKRRVTDKTRDFACLAVSGEDAMDAANARRRRAPVQAAILELLSAVGRVSVEELKYFTGCTIQSVRALEKAGYLSIEQEEVFRHQIPVPEELLPIPILTAGQQAAFDGLMRKIMIFLVVILSVLVDLAVQYGAGVTFNAVTGATCLWFIASEGVSVLENAAELGVPIPGILRKALELLQDSSGDAEE